ncbi:MAG: hypothetical protein PHD32_09040 [Eubacteriales bacterium]|nr:hypothetical protein [Eubacteriales bacterium]
MKKICLLMVALLLAGVLGGCGLAQKAQEKAAEKILEGASGGSVKVDIDGEKYTYQDEDGNTVEIGSTQWPTGAAADAIPKLDKGIISSVVNMEATCIIDIDEVEKADFDAYLQAVKNAGFTENAVEMTTEGSGFLYQATSGNKSIVMGYSQQEKHLQISAGLGE